MTTTDHEAELPEESTRLDRREALKKAAGAAVAAGVVWSAPRVEGLSIVPDYASAGTVSGLTRTIRFGDTTGPTYPGEDNYFKFKASPGTTPLSGPTENAALTIRADLDVAGDATLTVAQGILADGNPFSATLAYAIDPPHNQCQITDVNSNPGPDNNTWTATPVPNTSANFNQTINVGGKPTFTSRVDDVSVTITCA